MTRPDTTRLADFEPLRHAERALLRACARGDIARIGLRRPAERDARVSIRASFLVFLARGGDAFTPVRGRRIQLLGAWVEGRLDLGGAVVPLSLWFYRCVFEAEPLFDGAKVQGGLAFPDCELPGLLAEGCHVELDLALNAGCSVAGELRLRRVQVGGDLICTRLRMHGDDNVPSRRPLVADGARIEGDVRLGSSPEQGSGQGLESHGEVRFVGAHVGGDFHAGQARVTGALDARGARQAALVLDRIRVAGSVFLNTGFAAAGRVCLRRARIDGDVDCTAASFDMLGDASWGQGVALVLDRAEIGGELRLRDLSGPLLGASLAEARVGTLVDDASTWGERLVLDGFKYARFGRGAPVDAAFRLAWLGQQEPAHLQRDDMRLQPWQRVIAVLRRMGHSGAAVQVALRRERWLRRIGQVGDGSNVALRWVSQIGHRLWGALAGYGYRPQRLLGWGVLVWLLCAAVFAWAAREGWMVAPPATPAAPASAPLLAGIDALAYSLDRLLPLVDLQQASAWSPSATAGPADALRWLGRLETLFGWVLLSIGLVSLAGWTERDRDNDNDRDHPQR